MATFDAATAFRMGLLSEVVPRGTALDRAREVARRLAAKSPIVMKLGRDAFMRAHKLERRYQALVWGRVEAESGCIDQRLPRRVELVGGSANIAAVKWRDR